MASAFESIGGRQSWKAGEILEKYQGAMIGADGYYYASDGTKPFAGVVQYGAEAIGDMATVVTGIFPVVADGAIAAGDPITFSTAGKFKKAVAGVTDTVVCGIALTECATTELFSLRTIPVTTIIPKTGA